jgi:hypothetical protein
MWNRYVEKEAGMLFVQRKNFKNFSNRFKGWSSQLQDSDKNFSIGK